MKRLASENSDEETFDTDGETVIDGNFEDITDLQKTLILKCLKFSRSLEVMKMMSNLESMLEK